MLFDNLYIMILASEIEKRLQSSDYDGLLIFLEKELEEHPSDDEIRLRLALLLQSAFVGDYHSALRLLGANPNDIKSVVLRAYIEDTFQGEISSTSLENIYDIIIKKDFQSEYQNLVFLLQAFYYRFKDKNSYMEALLNSIKYDPFASYNYVLLSEMYSSDGDNEKAFQYLKTGISNILRIYSDMEYIDVTNFSEFVNERLRGIHITKVNYEELTLRLNTIEKTKD
ncbi:MAG: tetratricopeptide repeat [Bacteroidetes bacterium]|nr:tetratricopeptide repeat [Bacteroidota bacterium]